MTSDSLFLLFNDRKLCPVEFNYITYQYLKGWGNYIGQTFSYETIEYFSLQCSIAYVDTMFSLPTVRFIKSLVASDCGVYSKFDENWRILLYCILFSRVFLIHVGCHTAPYGSVAFKLFLVLWDGMTKLGGAH